MLDNQKYIIGNSKNLVKRNSSYEKISKFTPIYYKAFKNKESMCLGESMVLYTLDKYKYVGNHDRFILPLNEKIEFLKNQLMMLLTFLILYDIYIMNLFNKYIFFK